MAEFTIKNCDETFSFNHYDAEASFKKAGYDFSKCEKEYANSKFTAWDIICNNIDGPQMDKIFIEDIIDGKNPDFQPIDGDRNARTYLKIRQYFPDMHVDEEEDYWVASWEEDFVNVLKTVDLSIVSYDKNNVQFNGTLDGMSVYMVLDNLPDRVSLWFKKAVKERSVDMLKDTFKTMRDLDPSKSYDCFLMFDVGA